jgi:Protein of unknown function (DUF1302)
MRETFERCARGPVREASAAAAARRNQQSGGILMTSQSLKPGRRNTVLGIVIGTVLASYAGGAGALEFETDGGTRIIWNTTLSVGSSWRDQEPDPELFTRADGSLIGIGAAPLPLFTRPNPGDGLAGNQADSGTLNYDKGDRFSTPLKLLTDVEIRKGDFGLLVRGKAWYDDALENGDVRLGNQPNNYNGVRPGLGPQPGGTFTDVFRTPWPEASLSDDGFEDEQQFSNAMLLDAYLYGGFDVGETQLQLRLGRQVVNWGESVFIQGLNQINPIDVPAARRPGAELKEVLLPVAMAYANWGFNFGSMELFYQFEWDNTSIDSCGTYWAVTENNISSSPGRCNSATVITNVLGSQPRNALGQLQPVLVPQLGSNVFAQANGLFVPLIQGVEPRDSGQFGAAFRFPIGDTEIGLYGMNIHSRLPYISGRAGTLLTPTTPLVLPPGALSPLQTTPYVVAGIDPSNGLPFWRIPGTGANPLDAADDTTLRNPAPLHSGIGRQLGRNIVPGRAYWEYPDDIQVYGISAAMNLFSWSVSFEVSRHIGVPVQVNGNDLLQSLVVFLGPNATEGVAAALQGDGGYAQGWDRFNKTQFQVNTVKNFSNVLGAENLLLVAEVGYQENNVPDYLDGAVRYGRAFMFGVGSNPDLAGQLPVSGGNTCSPTFVNAPVPVQSAVFNPQPNGCRNDGYVTDDAWGYRLRLSADYNNVFNSGVTVTPSVFWAHDVDGVSMDPAFIEDRQVLGLGLRFNYNKRYNLEMNYVDYADTDFDPLFDRDYYSVSASVTF